MRARLLLAPSLVTLALSACGGDGGGPRSRHADEAHAHGHGHRHRDRTPPPKAAYDALTRDAFNRAAVRLNLPLYWAIDGNNNGAVDPDEVATLLFYPAAITWVENKAFTAAFDEAYRKLQDAEKDPLAGVTGTDELARRKLVLEDPRSGARDARPHRPPEREGRRQGIRPSHAGGGQDHRRDLRDETGVDALAAQVPKDDPASQSLFRRNWGPKCLGPKTEKDPECSAIPGSPKPIVRRLSADASRRTAPKFCEALEKHPDAKKLLDAVRRRAREGDEARRGAATTRRTPS